MNSLAKKLHEKHLLWMIRLTLDAVEFTLPQMTVDALISTRQSP
jgi:hypothetical protein